MINISKSYTNIPTWNVAGLFHFDKMYLDIFNFLEKNNVQNPIKYVFGSFASSFEGGRTNPDKIRVLDAAEIINMYNNLKISCRLILSNHLINISDLIENRKINYLLTLMSKNNTRYNLQNGIVFTLDSVANYIKKEYPNLEIVCSVIKPAIEIGWGKESIDYYNNLLNKYDYVVVNSGKVKDINFIQQLNHKEKIEVIVNSRCELNCPLSAFHYDNIAKSALIRDINGSEDLTMKVELDIWNKCRENRNKQELLSGSNFSEKELNNLLKMNISHFKIEGREWPIEILLRDFGDYIFDYCNFIRILRKMGMTF